MANNYNDIIKYINKYGKSAVNTVKSNNSYQDIIKLMNKYSNNPVSSSTRPVVKYPMVVRENPFILGNSSGLHNQPVRPSVKTATKLNLPVKYSKPINPNIDEALSGLFNKTKNIGEELGTVSKVIDNNKTIEAISKLLNNPTAKMVGKGAVGIGALITGANVYKNWDKANSKDRALDVLTAIAQGGSLIPSPAEIPLALLGTGLSFVPRHYMSKDNTISQVNNNKTINKPSKQQVNNKVQQPIKSNPTFEDIYTKYGQGNIAYNVPPPPSGGLVNFINNAQTQNEAQGNTTSGLPPITDIYPSGSVQSTDNTQQPISNIGQTTTPQNYEAQLDFIKQILSQDNAINTGRDQIEEINKILGKYPDQQSFNQAYIDNAKKQAFYDAIGNRTGELYKQTSPFALDQAYLDRIANQYDTTLTRQQQVQKQIGNRLLEQQLGLPVYALDSSKEALNLMQSSNSDKAKIQSELIKAKSVLDKSNLDNKTKLTIAQAVLQGKTLDQAVEYAIAQGKMDNAVTVANILANSRVQSAGVGSLPYYANVPPNVLNSVLNLTGLGGVGGGSNMTGGNIMDLINGAE